MAEPMAPDLAGYVRQALVLLERDAPVHFGAASQALGERAIAVRVDDRPPFSIHLGRPEKVTSASTGDVQVSLSQTDLDTLLTGDLSVERAVSSGRLSLHGPVPDLLALFDGLRACLHGALRCRALRELHARYCHERRLPH